MAGEAAEIEGIPVDEVNNLLFWSSLGGATAFTPVPGGIRVPVVRHLMVASQLNRAGLTQDILHRTGESFNNLGALSRGPPMTCFEIGKTCAYYGCCCCVVEQLFKKCCFIFTVKDAVEDTTMLMHEGWLTAFALKNGHLTDKVLKDKDELWRVREAILTTNEEVDTSPIQKAIHALLGTSKHKDELRDSAGGVMQALRSNSVKSVSDKAFQEALEATESEQRTDLKGLTKQMAEVLKANRPYLRKLENTFVENLRKLELERAKPSASLLG